MLKRFRRDPYFLLKYYLLSFALLVTALALLYRYPLHDIPSPVVWLIFLLALIMPTLSVVGISAACLVGLTLYFEAPAVSTYHLLLIPAGIYLGILSAVCMHNAAHYNFKPRWTNRVVGELAGLQQLLGFNGWAISHILHHQYADDLDKDPHPPGDLSFSGYMNRMKNSIKACMTRNYLDLWDNNQKTRRIWSLGEVFLVLNRYLRVCFLFVLMGPVWFGLLFLPSFLAQFVFYAHLNYYTHRHCETGSHEILNLTDGPYYRVMNFLFFGIYYHKNHHRNCSLFNPAAANRAATETGTATPVKWSDSPPSPSLPTFSTATWLQLAKRHNRQRPCPLRSKAEGPGQRLGANDGTAVANGG